MEDKTYNGWTNYPTWRVALELCEFEMDELIQIIENEASDVKDMMTYLQQHVGDILESEANGDFNSYSYNYASAFVSEVNFYEIATKLFDDYYEEQRHRDTIEYAKAHPLY